MPERPESAFLLLWSPVCKLWKPHCQWEQWNNWISEANLFSLQRKNNRLPFPATCMPPSSLHSTTTPLQPSLFPDTHLSLLAAVHIWVLLFFVCLGHTSCFLSIFGSNCPYFSLPSVLCLFHPSISSSASPAPRACFCYPFALLVSAHGPFLHCILQSQGWKCLFTSFACFSKEIILWSKGCSLGATALCLLFIFILLTSKLFLSLSLPRISLKHLSSASHWLVSAFLSFYQAPVGLLVLFSLPVSCSCIPADLHSLCLLEMGKTGSSTCSVLTCWGIHLSLSQWSEKNTWAGSLPFRLGIHPLLSFLLIRTVLCWSNQAQIRRWSGRLWPSTVGI